MGISKSIGLVFSFRLSLVSVIFSLKGRNVRHLRTELDRSDNALLPFLFETSDPGVHDLVLVPVVDDTHPEMIGSRMDDPWPDRETDTVARIVIGERSMKPSTTMLRWTATSIPSPRSDLWSLAAGVPAPSHARAILFSMARKAVCVVPFCLARKVVCAVGRVAVLSITLRTCCEVTLRISMDCDSWSPNGNHYTNVTSCGPDTHAPTIALTKFRL